MCLYCVSYFVHLYIQAFRSRDGYIMVGAGNDGQFVELCEVRVLCFWFPRVVLAILSTRIEKDFKVNA